MGFTTFCEATTSARELTERLESLLHDKLANQNIYEAQFGVDTTYNANGFISLSDEFMKKHSISETAMVLFPFNPVCDIVIYDAQANSLPDALIHEAHEMLNYCFCQAQKLIEQEDTLQANEYLLAVRSIIKHRPELFTNETIIECQAKLNSIVF